MTVKSGAMVKGRVVRAGGREAEAEGAGRGEDLCKKTLMKLQAQQTS